MPSRPISLSISQLANAAGVTTPTVRFYEEIGLLPRAWRSASGQRRYDPADVERLTLIRRCREFGFPIEQVRTISNLAISADEDCSQVQAIAAGQLAVVRGKPAELRALERSLATFVTRCDEACSGGPGRNCVVFEDLVAAD